jgi:hypothetical protein
MAEQSKETTGLVAFVFMFLVFFLTLLGLQRPVMTFFITGIFPNYTIITDVFRGEWIIMNKEPGRDDAAQQRREILQTILDSARHSGFDKREESMNTLLAKRDLREFTQGRASTLYFVNPYVAFSPLFLFISLLIAFLFSLFLPGNSSFSWMRIHLLRSYRQIESSLRKQFDSHDLPFDPILHQSSEEREDGIRRSTLPEIVISEMDDFVDINRWVRGLSVNPLIPLKFFFRYRISAKYSNLIQGFVAGGAAILIFVIGLRGLKLIPAEEPSLILMALSLEFMLLIVLMFSFAGSAHEERLDRVMKELEAEQRDAIKQQTDTLHQVLDRNMSGMSGIAGDDSIAGYEERKILDEVLSMMLREAERRRAGRGS